MLKFELRRLYRSKFLLILALLIGGAAAVGLGMSVVFSEHANIQNSGGPIMSFYNSFAQLSFPILGVCYAYYFAKDFENGTYDFCRQAGFGLTRIIRTRLKVLLGFSLVLLTAVYMVYLVEDDRATPQFVLFVFVTVALMIVFTAVSAAFIGVAFARPLWATLAMPVIWVVLSFVNFFGYGLTNQADTASFTSYVAAEMVGGIHSINYESLGVLGINFAIWGVPIAIGLALIWIVLACLGLHVAMRYRQSTQGY